MCNPCARNAQFSGSAVFPLDSGVVATSPLGVQEGVNRPDLCPDDVLPENA